MKTMHLNKVIAIAQVKLKAFMGKNCIIMPLFSIGFTLLMKYLYSSMSTGGFVPRVSKRLCSGHGAGDESGHVRNILPQPASGGRERKNTLRVLMTSSVNSLEFLPEAFCRYFSSPC